MEVDNQKHLQSVHQKPLKIKKMIEQDHTNKNNATPKDQPNPQSNGVESMDIETDNIVANLNQADIYIRKAI